MKLLVSALEPSSNLHLKELLRHLDGVKLMGIFDRSIAQGVPLYPMDMFGIMGVADALKKLPWFFKVADEMVDLAKDADVVLLMDGSGFNLPLAKKIKERYAHKRVIYYILPQVWASRPKRVQKLERYCDKLLCILPFEVDYYHSKKAVYVGHPLLDKITQKRDEAGTKGTFAFLPGSRESEIKRLMPHFVQLRRKMGNSIRAILVIPPHFERQKIAKLYPHNREFEIARDTHKALASSEYAFVCSGTATLEAALIGTPFTLAYIAKKIDFFIGTKIFGIKEVGLANIILRQKGEAPMHDELLQEKVTAQNLYDSYIKTDKELFERRADELKAYLSHGSSQRVAKLLTESLHKKVSHSGDKGALEL